MSILVSTRRGFAALASGMALLWIAGGPLTGSAAPGSEVSRVAGTDRFETAVSVSQRGWEEADRALLATGDRFPDALAAGALAARQGAPILLSGQDSLPASVGEELERLEVDEVTLLGGSAAVSEEVEAAVSELETAPDVTRLAGADRYETAATVAEAAGAPSGEVALALGTDFPDAVAAGALAASPARVPVLLTEPDAVPGATLEAIGELGAGEVLVLGGPAAIDESVEDELVAAGLAVTRVAGRDRYDTSRQAILEARERFPEDEPRTLHLATGEAFPDALTAAALAARERALLLINPTDRIPDASYEWLSSQGSLLSELVAIGGPAALSPQAVAEVEIAHADGLVWRRVPLDVDGVALADVASNGDTLVAVGHAGEAFDPDRAAVVLSQDAGETWEEVHDGALDDSTVMTAVTATDDGTFVAVGHEDSTRSSGVEPTASAWRSTDGREWERSEPSADMDTALLRDVTATAGGLIAVGSAGPGLINNAVWTSVEGRDWERVHAWGPGDRRADLEAVAAEGQDVVAMGIEFAPGDIEGSLPTVWRSDDGGASWQESELPMGEASGLGSTAAILHHQDRWTGVGNSHFEECFLNPNVWTSHDGREWTRVDHAAFDAVDDCTTTTGQQLTDLVDAGPGLLAGGRAERDLTPDDPQRAWLIASRDGERWREVPLQDSVRHEAVIEGLAPTPDGAVAVGRSVDFDPGAPTRPAIWVAAGDR